MNNEAHIESREIHPFSLQELTEDHPRWPDFVRCLEETAPEQAPFVLGDYARHLPCHLSVAFQDDQIVGFLRFGIQPVGAEEQCPPLILNGVTLTEAKIHAFAVHREHRGQGIGTALQRQAIRRARELGCYQLASHSGCGPETSASHHVKLSLGFSALPETHGGQQSIRFLMPLQAHHH